MFELFRVVCHTMPLRFESGSQEQVQAAFHGRWNLGSNDGHAVRALLS